MVVAEPRTKLTWNYFTLQPIAMVQLQTEEQKNRSILFCIHAQFQPPKIHLIFTRMDHRLIWLWPIYVIIRWRTRRCASRRVTRILLLLLLLLCRLVSVLHYFFIKCRKRLFSFLPLLKSHWLEKTSVKSLLRFIFGHWNWTTQIRAWTNPKEPWVI